MEYDDSCGEALLTRLPSVDNFPGLYDIPSVLGPMARTVEDVELASRIVFGQESENYDPAPIPYRDVTLPQKLKFGYYIEGRLALPCCTLELK